MFTSILPALAPFDISKHEGLKQKVIALYDRIKIKEVFCEIANKEDLDVHPRQNLLTVTDMIIQPGEPPYIKNFLRESLDILQNEITVMIRTFEDYDTILHELEDCLAICEKGFKENNDTNDFTIDHKIPFYVCDKEKRTRVLIEHLYLEDYFLGILRNHFHVRKGFYEELKETFIKALDWHTQKPDHTLKPYKFVSDNPELELSEILFTLYRVTLQLEFDQKTGGTFAKFKKEFFELFGLSDKDYDKKVQQILQRKKNEHRLNELATQLNDYHSKHQKLPH